MVVKHNATRQSKRRSNPEITATRERDSSSERRGAQK